MNCILSIDEYEDIMKSTLLNEFDKKILQLTNEGINNCEIARNLSCSEGKIRYHKKRIDKQIKTYIDTGSRNKYTIYKFVFPNNKIYIGMTRLDPEQRWKKGMGYINNKKMFNDILIYGWNNIQTEIVDEFNNFDEASSKEQALINYFNSNKDEHGYNNTK